VATRAVSETDVSGEVSDRKIFCFGLVRNICCAPIIRPVDHAMCVPKSRNNNNHIHFIVLNVFNLISLSLVKYMLWLPWLHLLKTV
jgi:hypothetical protein